MAAPKRNPEVESAAKARWLEKRAARRPGASLSLTQRPARELFAELGKRPFRAAGHAAGRQLHRAGSWWNDNRTLVAVAAVSAFFGFAMWSAYLNAQEKNRAAAPHKTGWGRGYGGYGGYGGFGHGFGYSPPAPALDWGSLWGAESMLPGAYHAPAEPLMWDPLSVHDRFDGGGFW